MDHVTSTTIIKVRVYWVLATHQALHRVMHIISLSLLTTWEVETAHEEREVHRGKGVSHGL